MIAAHGFQASSSSSTIISASHFSVPLAEALVQKMAEFAENIENMPASFSLAPSVYFLISSREGISPTALRQMDVWKMFEYENAPLRTGDSRSYEELQESHHPDWHKPKTIAENLVALLIQQAGLMVADFLGTKAVEYDALNDAIKYARHHWRYLKPSRHYKELLLLWANFHSENTYREAVRDIRYLNAMKVLKTRFENGRCPILWNEVHQRKYYGRLYDLIAEWNKRPSERDFEQDKFE
jgi:hypothetical protein